jgi:hypothetical protein
MRLGWMRRRTVAVAAAVGFAVVATACGNDGRQAVEPPPGGPKTISFDSGGFKLVGKVYGDGQVGVVLPPSGFGGGQGAWLDYPAELARSGYMVLTFNLKGQCTTPASAECSEGSLEDVHGPGPVDDVTSAVEFLRSRGAQEVFLIGARFSGLHVIRAAALDEFTGVITLSAGMTIGGERALDEDVLFWVQDVKEPHLMIYAEEEAAGGRKLSSSSGGAHELILVPESVGGAELIAGSTGTESAREAVLDFLEQHSAS